LHQSPCGERWNAHAKCLAVANDPRTCNFRLASGPAGYRLSARPVASYHSLIMRLFDDFDAWGDAISGAHLRMACDSVQFRRWALSFLDLGGIELQVAFEGGGNLCYGANTHAGTILFLPLSHSAVHICNGKPLDEASLLVMPRGSDFRIWVPRSAHSWCSIILPSEAPRLSAWVARGLEATCEIRRLARSIAANLLGRPADTPAHRAAGRELAAAAAACLPAPREPATCGEPGRPKLDRAAIIRGAMDRLDAEPILPTAADLANDLGITSRTLLRAFHESYGISPKRYLLLRELHAVRRELCTGANGEPKVTDVLSRHGIWEFGRFAARYRRQFGELPSATLRRARG
jgi:AraC family transcriptional regulator, ethanolamine operon transcriptional activator